MKKVPWEHCRLFPDGIHVGICHYDDHKMTVYRIESEVTWMPGVLRLTLPCFRIVDSICYCPLNMPCVIPIVTDSNY